MGNLPSLFPQSAGCFNTTFSADAWFFLATWRVGFTLPRDKRDFHPSLPLPRVGGRIFRIESASGAAEHVCLRARGSERA